MVVKDSYIGQLVEYIKRNLKKGYTPDSLKWALISQDHSKIEVERALKIVEKELAQEAPRLETKPEIKYEIVEPKNYEKRYFWKKFFK